MAAPLNSVEVLGEDTQNDNIAGLTDPDRVRKLLEKFSREEGFRRMGVARADRPPHFDRFEAWLDAGRDGNLEYLRRSRPDRSDPRRLLPGARSIVVLAHPYPAAAPAASDGTRIARYALSPDYHRTLREKCERILRRVRSEAPAEFAARVCVDKAPLCERDFAAAAGVGWIGKNAMLLDPALGSYFLLCEILTDLDLDADAPLAEACGSCVACLRACPTGALVAPRELDARLCLSYWTIEQRSAIPESIVERQGSWVFGCDICQEVCPYNQALPSGRLERSPAPLREWLSMPSTVWKRGWKDTPLARAGGAGMRRNAAAAAQATRRRDLLPALQGLADGAHPVVARQARAAAADLDGGAR
jgi:epoxyqueuosine reductase